MKNSPWGKVDFIKTYIEKGIVRVETAGHGGLKVYKKFNDLIPEYIRNANGWYEEDCEWSIIWVCLKEYIQDKEDDFEKWYQVAVNTFRNYYPDAYEKFFNVVLKEGESYKRDKENFYKVHANDRMVTCAWGDWHDRVPRGSVLVCAKVGGRYNNGGEESYWLVDEEEYKNNKKIEFIINPAIHKPVKPL